MLSRVLINDKRRRVDEAAQFLNQIMIHTLDVPKYKSCHDAVYTIKNKMERGRGEQCGRHVRPCRKGREVSRASCVCRAFVYKT